MTAKELAELLSEHPRLVVHVSNQSDEIAMHARSLIYALDRGYLNYTPDEPESAFIRCLRESLARSDQPK